MRSFIWLLLNILRIVPHSTASYCCGITYHHKPSPRNNAASQSSPFQERSTHTVVNTAVYSQYQGNHVLKRASKMAMASLILICRSYCLRWGKGGRTEFHTRDPDRPTSPLEMMMINDVVISKDTLLVQIHFVKNWYNSITTNPAPLIIHSFQSLNSAPKIWT